MENLKELWEQARVEIEKAPSDGVLGEIETKWLGRKGRFTEILRTIKDVPSDERGAFGAEANRIKMALEQLIRDRRSEFHGAADNLKSERVDVTLPGRKMAVWSQVCAKPSALPL